MAQQNVPAKHPMQPLAVEDGTVRFKANKIVDWLWRSGAVDLNKLIAMYHSGMISQEDVTQFWQLLGYSVSGYGELSFIDPAVVAWADAEAEKLLEEAK
jgi:hypothetical protein